jgi:hypothetical protein
MVAVGVLLSIGMASSGRVQSTGLTAAGKKWLTRMREEEKLARDVYIALYDSWGTRIFGRIANAEQMHTSVLKRMLSKYGVPDPAAGNGLGVFTDPDFQVLYNQLVEKGRASLADAFRVGVQVEELDIADLDSAIAATGQKDIKKIYGNLRRGSLNHLRAYRSSLANIGG